MTFVKTLGFEINVYSTTLGDGNNVYITKHLPNQSAYPAVCDYPIHVGPVEKPHQTPETVYHELALHYEERFQK